MFYGIYINYIKNIDDSIFQNVSDIDDGISEDIIEKIKLNSDDPQEALVIYFENKKYGDQNDLPRNKLQRRE